MNIHHELTDGPGYCAEFGLTPAELAEVRGMIGRQYLDRMREIAPDLAGKAAEIGIENYHLLPITFDHAAKWPKETRLLPAKHVQDFLRMEFCRRIEQDCGPVIISNDELNWRVVRPNMPGDIGPVHADKWFWDAGYGYGLMPEGYDRFKIWIPIHSEPGANGLSVKSNSHKSDAWKHHFEVRGGVRKPVLDEREEDLAMELLPLPPGRMVMFHDKLLHGGVVNRGTKCRVSIELTILFRAEEAEKRLRGPGRAAA